MQIEYSLQRADFLIYQLFAASKSKAIAKSRKRSRLVIPVVYTFLAFVLSLFTEPFYPLAFFGIGLVWYLIHPVLMRRRFKHHFEKYIDEHYRNRFDKTITLDFGDEKISTTDYMGESTLKIAEITDIDEIEGYTFIKFSSSEALIIPVGRLANPDALKQQIDKLALLPAVVRTTRPNWQWT